jgi:hypothetical protein
MVDNNAPAVVVVSYHCYTDDDVGNFSYFNHRGTFSGVVLFQPVVQREKEIRSARGEETRKTGI